MPFQLLDAVPLGVFFLAAAGLLWVGAEFGCWAGAWRRERVKDEKEQTVNAMVASMLGLVALMMGFTFNLAAMRFDARRLGVLEESNAIGTTWLRTRFLPQPQQSESARLLKEYVDVRLQGVQVESQMETALARSAEIHDLLWEQASAAAEQKPGSITVGLYIQSLNELIDLHAKRVLLGTRSRIPLVLWIALFFLSVLGMASMGYQAALSSTRRSPALVPLVLAFASVMYLIADLDRGLEGMLRISQQSMIDVKSSIEGASKPTAPPQH